MSLPRLISTDTLTAIVRKYQLLWPPRDKDSLKKAWYAALKRHHPDKGGSKEAAQDINLWYEVSEAILDGKMRQVRTVPRPQPQPQPIMNVSIRFTQVSTATAATTATATTTVTGGFGGVRIIWDNGQYTATS